MLDLWTNTFDQKCLSPLFPLHRYCREIEHHVWISRCRGGYSEKPQKCHHRDHKPHQRILPGQPQVSTQQVCGRGRGVDNDPDVLKGYGSGTERSGCLRKDNQGVLFSWSPKWGRYTYTSLNAESLVVPSCPLLVAGGNSSPFSCHSLRTLRGSANILNGPYSNSKLRLELQWGCDFCMTSKSQYLHMHVFTCL